MTVKMETQDGTVLDTETKALQVGNAKSGPGVEEDGGGCPHFLCPGSGSACSLYCSIARYPWRDKNQEKRE